MYMCVCVRLCTCVCVCLLALTLREFSVEEVTVTGGRTPLGSVLREKSLAPDFFIIRPSRLITQLDRLLLLLEGAG